MWTISMLKIILQLALLGIFFEFFGLPSFHKYMEERVLVTRSKQETGSIPAPAVTICGKNPNTKGAWKDMETLEAVLDTCEDDDDVFTSVESQSWSREEVVLRAIRGNIQEENLLNQSLWRKEFYKKYSCFTFVGEFLVGTNDAVDELQFFLNRTMVYKLYVHSPTYFLQNVFPELPINGLKIVPSKDCKSYVQLTLTEQKQLNTVQNPCEATAGYSFTRSSEVEEKEVSLIRLLGRFSL